MAKRRVLLIANRFAPDIGGLAVSSTRTAASLCAAGADVDVLAWTRAVPSGQLETQPGGAGKPVVHRLGLFHNWDLSLQHTSNIIEWLHHEHTFDLIWGHYLYPPGFTAVLLGGQLDIPSVVSARGNDVDRMMFPPGDFSRLLWTLDRATAITSVSDDLSNKVRVLLGRDPVVVRSPNVVDGETFKPMEASASLRESLGIGADEVVLGFSGELRHKKGLPFLLRALTDIRRQRPACLLVIGEVRSRELEHLATYAADHPEDRHRILVTGHIDDPTVVNQHLALCDLFLMPSLWDGMPNAVLEAMSAGLCVLGSDAGGIPELIEHGETGFLVPRAELGRLGEGALEILALPAERRREIGSAARAFMLERHHPDREVLALESLLSRLVPRTSS